MTITLGPGLLTGIAIWVVLSTFTRFIILWRDAKSRRAEAVADRELANAKRILAVAEANYANSVRSFEKTVFAAAMECKRATRAMIELNDLASDPGCEDGDYHDFRRVETEMSTIEVCTICGYARPAADS